MAKSFKKESSLKLILFSADQNKLPTKATIELYQSDYDCEFCLIVEFFAYYHKLFSRVTIGCESTVLAQWRKDC